MRYALAIVSQKSFAVQLTSYRMISEATIDTSRKKYITLRTTSYEKTRVSVCLAKKADGTQLKPVPS